VEWCGVVSFLKKKQLSFKEMIKLASAINFPGTISCQWRGITNLYLLYYILSIWANFFWWKRLKKGEKKYLSPVQKLKEPYPSAIRKTGLVFSTECAKEGAWNIEIKKYFR
jgi:hypothetical protein